MSKIGPQLPDHLRQSTNNDEDSSSEDDCYGPRLPNSGCGSAPPSRLSGAPPPSRLTGAPPPSRLSGAPPNNDDSSSSSDSSDYGPSLPPGMVPKREEESDDDDEIVGPSVHEMKNGSCLEETAKDFEMRARKMREKIEGGGDEEVKRETWMLELPEEKANKFGFLPTARQFSRKGTGGGGGKDQSWTNIPGQERREGGGDEEDRKVMGQKKRDKEMEKVAGKLREKRGHDSLMDIHEKKLKKKKKDKDGDDEVIERRPFDRDTDLQANRFDEAAKKTMLKQAAKINDRFSSGNQKFL